MGTCTKAGSDIIFVLLFFIKYIVRVNLSVSEDFLVRMKQEAPSSPYSDREE